MARFLPILLVALIGLTACEAPEYTGIASPNDQAATKIYRIRSGQTTMVQFRMLDSVNALRQVAGAQPVELNARLNAAAATHARDMSVQNRPWHFGSDGSSPLDRVARVGYTGAFLGEAISESYETELETLAAWMADGAIYREVILDPRARDMGFAWFQEPNGKIWWTLVMGAGETAPGS